MEEQRPHFHPNVQRLGLKKRLGVKRWDHLQWTGLPADQAAGENREAQIAESHFAAEGEKRVPFLGLWLKGIGVK